MCFALQLQTLSLSKDLVLVFCAGEQDIIFCSSEDDESAHFIRLAVTLIDNCLAGGFAASPLPTNTSQLHSHPINTGGASVPPHYPNSMQGGQSGRGATGRWGGFREKVHGFIGIHRGRCGFTAEMQQIRKSRARDKNVL